MGNQNGGLYQPKFPDHWERRPLYNLARWVNGLAFRGINFSPTGWPVIKIAEVKNGVSGQTKFTQQSFDDSVRVRRGDLIFSWSGQPETSIDAFWWRGTDGWLNQHLFRVTPASGVDRTFFYYLLRYLKPNFVGIARNKQTTGLGHVTRRDLETIEAALPPLSEQRAIAEVLGALDNKIEANRRSAQLLDSLGRALFARVRKSEVRVGDVAQVLMGQSPPGSTYNACREGLPFYQGTRDFGFRHPSPRVWCSAPSRIAEPNDVLVSVRAPVGALNAAWERCALGRGVASLRSPSTPSILFHAIASDASSWLPFEGEGTVFGSIRKEQLVELKIGWPPDDEVEHQEAVLAALDARLAASERESQVLGTLRDTLLPKLLSGELRAHSAEALVGDAT